MDQQFFINHAYLHAQKLVELYTALRILDADPKSDV